MKLLQGRQKLGEQTVVDLPQQQRVDDKVGSYRLWVPAVVVDRVVKLTDLQQRCLVVAPVPSQTLTAVPRSRSATSSSTVGRSTDSRSLIVAPCEGLRSGSPAGGRVGCGQVPGNGFGPGSGVALQRPN